MLKVNRWGVWIGVVSTILVVFLYLSYDRNIDPREFRGFEINNAVPPSLPIQRNKVYYIISCEKYLGQKVERKESRSPSSRLYLYRGMYVFTFKDENNHLQKVALDLDDEDVEFYTAVDFSIW